MKKIALLLSVVLLLFGCQKQPENVKPEIIWNSIEEVPTFSYDRTLSYEDLLKVTGPYGFEMDTSEHLIEGIRYAVFGMKQFEYEENGKSYWLQPVVALGLDYGDSDTVEKIVSIEGFQVFAGDETSYCFDGHMISKLSGGNSVYCSFYGDIYDVEPFRWYQKLASFLGFAVEGKLEKDGFVKNVSEEDYYICNRKTSLIISNSFCYLEYIL